MAHYNDKHKDEVILEFGGLRDEETHSGQICPACKGGPTKEGSLSVSRRGGVLLWKCHRASCDFHGAHGSTRADGDQGPVPKSNPRGVYVPTTPLNKAYATFLATKYGLTGEAVERAELGWTGDSLGRYGRRISFPIFDPSNRKRGESYRSYEGAKPKNVITLADADEIAFAWYRWKRSSKILVLVEDQVSAIKLAPHVHAAALLGTHLSQEKIDEIKSAGKYGHVILSLDQDAVLEAVKLQLKWANQLPGMCIQGIHKDIKDMSNEEFQSYLKRLE